MKYLELELTNWGPHQHRLLKFDPAAKVIAIAGENDKGKSWIIRALAGTFVTGKNEYFDKTAIFDGEEVAETRLMFLSRLGKTHEVRRVFTKKDAEGSDEIYLDGEKISPTKYVEFLCAEFGVTDPKILLSLAISMQGETHFYLKAKKRDREEGLRSLRALDTIDAWNEHLKRLVSVNDKSLAEKKNTLLGKKTTLEDQKKDILARIKTLQEETASLTSGKTPSGKEWQLQTQTAAWHACEKLEADKATLEREIQTLQTNLNLFKESLGRLEEEKANSPLKDFTPQEIQEKGETLENEENLHRETLNWKRLATEEAALQTFEAAILALETEIKAIILPLTEAQEKALAAASQEWELAKKDLARMAPGPKTDTEPEEKKSKVAALKIQEAAKKEKQEQTKAKTQAVDRAKRMLKSNLEDTGVKPPTQNLEDWKLLITQRIGVLQKELTSKKISPGEANLLKQRILANWPEGKEGPILCPICEDDLSQNTKFADAPARTKLQKSLETELAENSDGSPQELPGGAELQSLILLETLLRKEIPLIEEEEQEAQKLQKNLKEGVALEALQEEREQLEAQLKAWATRAITEGEVTHKQELVAELCNASSRDLKETVAKLLEETRSARSLQKSKTEQFEEKKTQRTAAAERVQTAKNACGEKTPQLRILLLQEESTIREEHTRITRELETFRRNRTALAPTLEKILQEKTKIQETESAEKAKKATLAELQKKTPWDTGLLHPEDGEDPKEAGALWLKKEKRASEVETLLKEELPKSLDTETKIKETIQEIEAVCKEVADMEASQEVVNFLDYKNAPRKLLAMTVDHIFYEANKIAKTFQLGMALSQGKNLEFNVVQSRNGKEIIQKTERLGFGKANVLGICTRLAAQKVLAPKTGFLILDEPSAYVDTRRKNAMREFLQQLGETQGIEIPQIILVEHEESIAQAANQILWID